MHIPISTQRVMRSWMDAGSCSHAAHPVLSRDCLNEY